jgi:hypothetical protein
MFSRDFAGPPHIQLHPADDLALNVHKKKYPSIALVSPIFLRGGHYCLSALCYPNSIREILAIKT